MIYHNPSPSKSAPALGFLWLVFLMVIIIGWGMNIVDVVRIDSLSNIGSEEILHIVGIFFVPLGSFMGIFF